MYEDLKHYNLTKKREVVIVFDDMITGMDGNKKLSAIVTELFLRGRTTFRLFLYHNFISIYLEL